jgi:hypothetical protein
MGVPIGILAAIIADKVGNSTPKLARIPAVNYVERLLRDAGLPNRSRER